MAAQRPTRSFPWVAVNPITGHITQGDDPLQTPPDQVQDSGVLHDVDDNEEAGKKAQQVEISGFARNLLGSRITLKFKQIIEADAIYYISQFDFQNEETYRFEVNIKQGSQSQTLKFSQKFYVN